MIGSVSLAGRLLALQLVVVALIVSIGAAITLVQAQRRTSDQQRERVLAVAEIHAGWATCLGSCLWG